MPWIAKHDGEKKGAWQVPAKTDAKCVECGGRVRVWRESSDGTARHFKHIANMGGGQGGGGSAACESVAESDKHIKWKNFAAEKLAEVFDGDVSECRVEKELDAPKSGKDRRVGDAVLTFENRDPQLGKGVVVEVQYRNHTKDIEETTEDYVEQDYSVVWTGEDDYSTDHCRLSEVDFRTRAQECVWPEYTPSVSDWRVEKYDYNEIQSRWQRAWKGGLTKSGAPATLPPEWCDEKAREIWESQYWHNLFFKRTIDHEPLSSKYLHEHYTDEVKDELDSGPESTVILPPDWVGQKSKQLWESQDWDDLFSPPEEYFDFWDFSEVPATIPKDWVAIKPAEYWRKTEWNARFRGSHSFLDDLSHQDSSLEVEVPISKWVREETPPDQIREALKHGHELGLLEREEERASIEKPITPFEDVQCHNCGAYAWAPKAGDSCGKCGESYDWEWNVYTGRIKEESVPEQFQQKPAAREIA